MPQTNLQALTGRRETAVYKDTLIPSYRGNPLIEALPPILGPNEVGAALRRHPVYSVEERDWSAHLRLHVIANALQFFEPMPIHLDLEQRISRMIRTGYQARNPIAQTYWKEMNNRVAALQSVGSRQPFYRSTPNGMTIIGIAGGGKTTAVEEILMLYPQVLCHSGYEGRPFSYTQVVWLKLTCPFDGSVKALCFNFLHAMDDILGTNYANDYSRNGRGTVDQLLQAMARIASIHALGVVVIDEIQHLSTSKSGGADQMLNFFVQLINTIGLPVVLVGTYKAMPLLQGEFRQIRRGCGQGDLVWERMKKDEIWEFFLESLFRYQYTQQFVPLTQEMSDALYECSQGITDFAVKMFMLAQASAIGDGQERISPGLIRSVAEEHFKTARPVLKALREGDMDVLRTLNDVHPIDFGFALQQSSLRRAMLESSGGIKTDQPEAVSPSLIQPVVVADSPQPAPAVQARSVSKKKSPPMAGSLMQIASAGRARHAAPYDALTSAGLIKNAQEFLEEAV